jgi:hypothetical protein
MYKSLYVISMILLVGCNSAISEPQALPSDTALPGPELAQRTEATGATTASEMPPVEGATREVAPFTELVALDHESLLDQLLYGQVGSSEAGAILNQIAASGDQRFVAALIDTLRYQSRLRVQIGDTLRVLTGQELPPDWFEWVEWAGKHPEIESFPSYPAWKSRLYSQIDPSLLRFLNADVKVAAGSRVEEIVWGGVLVDGIPALDNPTMVDPAEAEYLIPEERVFGVSLNGDTRAYPARFLDWHEMFNDVVGGEPVSLAY